MAAYDGKTITVTEFRELGFIQELNRRFLHPLGLALEVIIDDAGEERIERVWDNRDDPEGFIFGEDIIDIDKARAIQDAEVRAMRIRLEALGFDIQPLPSTEGVQVRDLAVGARFAWQDGVWKVVGRDPDWVDTQNEAFSNHQMFRANAEPGESSWFTYVRLMPR